MVVLDRLLDHDGLGSASLRVVQIKIGRFFDRPIFFFTKFGATFRLIFTKVGATF
jgi:hypothetical protein